MAQCALSVGYTSTRFATSSMIASDVCYAVESHVPKRPIMFEPLVALYYYYYYSYSYCYCYY